MKITPLGRLWLFLKLKKQFALPYTISECLAIENIERLKISAEYAKTQVHLRELAKEP